MHFNRWFRLDKPDGDPDKSFISAGSYQLWLRRHEADGNLLNLLSTAINQLAGLDWPPDSQG